MATGLIKNTSTRWALSLRERCKALFEFLDIKDDPLFEIVLELGPIAVNGGYVIEKKLDPNVDFCFGIILKAAGTPTSMFTVFFPLRVQLVG